MSDVRLAQRLPRWGGIEMVVVAAALAVPPGRVMAQTAADPVPDRAAAVEIRKQFMDDLDTLHTKFVALAQAIPADKYSWRPAAGVRSVGEVFMHVASEFYVYTPMSFGGARSPVIPKGEESMKKFEAMSSKPEVLKHLNDGYAYAKTTVNGLDPASLTGKLKIFGGEYNILETSYGMAGDMHEHLGQLIAYARENGIKPPWTK
jgi:uncharacterized damage-inducible protein DinB